MNSAFRRAGLALAALGCLGLPSAPGHGAEAPKAAPPPLQRGVALSPAAGRLLQSLPFAGPEPALRWEWDPTAWEPLAHPVRRDFGWRLAELRKKSLPDVARARLNLELAFLEMSPAAPPGADSAGAEARAREARRWYGRLLAQSPGRGEYLTDLGDLYRLLGHADSALTVYRQSWSADRPPARLFSRLANAELENLEARGDSVAFDRFHQVRRAGLQYFLRPAPDDSTQAARFFYDAARFRMDMAVLESYADRRLHPKAWENAGPDSLFAVLARVVAPETRKLAALAADYDTSYAEAYGLVGTLITGQAYLPISARGLILRGTVGTEDSLAAALLEVAQERGAQKKQEMVLAGGCLARCEQLEPGRYPRVRQEQARLALLFGDYDGAGGLWRALLTREPGVVGHGEGLYTVYRLEAALPPRKKGLVQAVPPRVVAAKRLEAALAPFSEKTLEPPLLALLGWARTEQGKIEPGLADFRRAAQADSLEWRARLNLAIDAIHNLNPPGSVDHLRVVGQQFNALDEAGQSRYCAAVGLLLLSKGSQDEARRWLAEARRFDPRNPAARAMTNIN